MRLLFDQNLSPRLPRKLARIFPDSVHIRDVELQRADDSDVWQYAREHGFTIVTKDSDFRQLSFLNGHPPKVIWIRRGNCSTDEIELILRLFSADLADFILDSSVSYLAMA